MRLNLYSVHDQAVKEFIGPEVARTHGEAERKFKDNVNNPEMGLLYRHPEQFTLVHVGHYESETGTITGLQEGPQTVATGLQMRDAQVDWVKQQQDKNLRKAN